MSAGSKRAQWAKFWRTMRDASSEPGCSCDHEQPCPDDDGSYGLRDAITGRCETFEGDGCRDDSHRAKVHDSDDQEDRNQTGTAVAAIQGGGRVARPYRRWLPACGRARVLIDLGNCWPLVA